MEVMNTHMLWDLSIELTDGRITSAVVSPLSEIRSSVRTVSISLFPQNVVSSVTILFSLQE